MFLSRKSAAVAFIGAFLAAAAFFPLSSSAQSTSTFESTSTAAVQISEDRGSEELFEARVLEVVEEKEGLRVDGSMSLQQRLKLKGLTGGMQEREFEFNGIGEIDAVAANIYRPADRVLVMRQTSSQGEESFYVVDYIRRWPLFWLALLFVILVMIVSAGKGFRSLIGLVISFWAIMGIAIPLIFRGWSPLWVGAATAAAIFIILVYLSEGFNRKANLAVASAFLCLLLTAVLASLFTHWTRLTGMAQEETMFLIGLGRKGMDFSGLFLAGILIGTLGVLDDMILGQIEAVSQIKAANPALPADRVALMAMKVGKTHIGAMVNTLFLAYAGASLPLLLLFSVKEPPFLTFSQVLNNETVASEIVRTLVGSIGLVLAMPIATYLAAYRLKPPKNQAEPGRHHRHA